jgi:hypothetical protein
MLRNVDEKCGIREGDEGKREVHPGKNHRDLRKGGTTCERDRERKRKSGKLPRGISESGN